MAFKADFCNVNSNSINHSPETNSKYEIVFKTFCELCEKYFLIKDFQIKVKDLQAPWVSKGLKKLSKQKQTLYIKFLKDRSIQNKQIYKNWHMANNERNPGKSKLNSTRFHKSINVNGKSIKTNSHIAEDFNKCFTM